MECLARHPGFHQASFSRIEVRASVLEERPEQVGDRVNRCGGRGNKGVKTCQT